MKVKLQREAEGSPNDARGDSNSGSSGANDDSVSSDWGQDHSSNEDADGKADTQATSSSQNNNMDSDSDLFKHAKMGRKCTLWGPPAGAEHRGDGDRHVGGDMDTSKGSVG
jgi:hypothetical protein